MSFRFSYKELIATGLSGALLGALSPVASVVIMAIVKAYSSSVAARDRWRFPGLLYIIGACWWGASQPAGIRQSILLEGLRAGLVSTVISASAVAAEVIAREDLTCLVWQECQQENPPGPEPTVADPTVGP